MVRALPVLARLHILLAGLAACLALTGAVGAHASTLPPDVPALTERTPAHHKVSGKNGTQHLRGFFRFAGEYLIETDPYDSATERKTTRFIVRRATDHARLYALREGNGLNGPADNEVFSDGALLAVRLRDTPKSAARISIHDLTTGKRLHLLPSPTTRAADDFGHHVWFTQNRILVAAPGGGQPAGSGAICVFDRATGAFIASVGPGVADARFGSAQPHQSGSPYLQTSGNAALIVHGDAVFRLVRDQLHRMELPPVGKRQVHLRDALITENRIIIGTSENTAGGRLVPGRVLGFNVGNGALRYTLQAEAVEGSKFFPSRLALHNNRLFVHDGGAGLPEKTYHGALHAYDQATGAHLDTVQLPFFKKSSHDHRSLTLSGDQLWLKAHRHSASGFSTTLWQAYDPDTLEPTIELTPPGDDWFIGAAPYPLGNDRFGVLASRHEPFGLFPSTSAPLLEAASSSSENSIIRHASTGLLLYNRTTHRWTHRLMVGSASWADLPKLNVVAGDRATKTRAAFTLNAGKISDFDTRLPSPTPTVTLEARITYTPAPGFAYDLLRRAANATEFALEEHIPSGNGVARTEVLPYSDFTDSVAYRLDGFQRSRHLTEPVGDPVALGEQPPTALVGHGSRLAIRIPEVDVHGFNRPGTVQLFNTATGELELTLVPSSGTARGPVALNDDYIVIGIPGTAGAIDVFNAVSGARIRTLTGNRALGSSLALSGNRLAATWVATTYAHGVYTHSLHLTVYDLPSGATLHTQLLGAQTATHIWAGSAPTVVHAGNHLVVPVGDGSVHVLEFSTGQLLHTLTSPAPAPNQYFGAWLAADGDWLAIGAPGTGEVFVYALPSGELAHTLILVDRPGGIVNFATDFPRLAIDGANGLLMWFADGNFSLPVTTSSISAAYVFDLTTGLEVAKAHLPYGQRAEPRIQGATLLDGQLHALASNRAWVKFPLLDSLAEPLQQTTDPLAPIPVAHLAFPTRPGVSYQPQFSVDQGATWQSSGSKIYGDGQPATVRVPLPPDCEPETVRLRFETRWETRSPWIVF